VALNTVYKGLVMQEAGRSIGRTGWSLGSLLLAGVASSVLTAPAEASLTIIPTYSGGVTASAKAAFAFAAGEYQTLFTDPVQVNIQVNTGTTGLGSSSTALLGTLTYGGMRSALMTDYAANPSAARTTAESAGGSIFTTTDPTGGGHFLVARADAKALGLIPTDLVNDGTFTYNRTLTYTFDHNNRMVPGAFDFTGVAEHEISEIMGRISLLGANLDGSPDFLNYELFRYTGNNTRGITNNGAGNYFSIDNGTTNLHGYNNAALNGGDAQDWDASVPTDPYNAFTGTNQGHMISSEDVTALNVIGWDTQVVPAPLIGFGFPAFLAVGGFLFGARLLDRAKRAARFLGVA
jgi:hypothetical protein